MKITEQRIKQNVSAANANSRHTGVGLRVERNGKGYTVSIIHRVNGAICTSWVELSASEANVAVTMFNQMAELSRPHVEGAQI